MTLEQTELIRTLALCSFYKATQAERDFVRSIRIQSLNHPDMDITPESWEKLQGMKEKYPEDIAILKARLDKQREFHTRTYNNYEFRTGSNQCCRGPVVVCNILGTWVCRSCGRSGIVEFLYPVKKEGE